MTGPSRTAALRDGSRSKIKKSDLEDGPGQTAVRGLVSPPSRVSVQDHNALVDARILDKELEDLDVLLFNEFFYPDNFGGTPTATSNIATQLTQNLNAKVRVVTGRSSYRDASKKFDHYEEWGDVKIHRVSSPNWIRSSKIQRFIGNLIFAGAVSLKALFMRRPDVVLVTTAPLTLPIAAKLLLNLRGIPYVYLIYDIDPDRTVAMGIRSEDSKAVRIIRKLQSGWLSSAGRVVTIGRCMRDHLITNYKIDPDKVDVVPVGADPDLVRPVPHQTEFRKKHKIEGFVVLYSGNFGLYHDFDTMLSAAETLQREKSDVTFILVGNGHKHKYVKDQVAKRGLHNVRLLPFVQSSELSDMLGSADLQIVSLDPEMEGLCVPSKFYTCMASGRPILAVMSEGTEVSRVIRETGCGFRVNVGDAGGMVQAIKNARSDTTELERMGQKARQVFDDLYSTPKVIALLRESLSEVVRSNDKRSRRQPVR